MKDRDEWLSSCQTIGLARATMTLYASQRALCARAYDGMIKTRAVRFIWGKQSGDDVEIPKEFWWARGEAALKQNWATGDFETWIENKIHCRAYGVQFYKAEVLAFLGPASAQTVAPTTSQRVGRPPAEWWDDMWIEICRQLYLGDLKPTKQVEIENAMKDWIAANGYDASESTVRPRARKLWKAISAEDKN